MRLSKALLAAAAMTMLASVPLEAQAPDSSRTGEALRVFLDCQNASCDFDFFRTEITFVDWVRDRRVAQLHLLITSQPTGSGGREYTLEFAGQEQFAGIDQVLKHVTGPTDSDDEVRRGVVRIIKLGLARYVAATPLGSRISMTYERPQSADSARRETRDPWNYWVFTANANANLSGESRYSSSNYNGSLQANRVTAAWKFQSEIDGSYNQQQYVFDFDDGNGVTRSDTSRSYAHSYSGGALVVKSLGEHWSAGGIIIGQSSSYSNEKLTLQAGPAVEYNLFPYSQSTRRQLTLRYMVRANRFVYNEETIYFLDHESRWDHSLVAQLATNQKWGNAQLSAETSQYFFDLSKRRVNIYGNADVRLFKGFSVNAYASYSLVHDQLAIERGGADPVQVLLRLRELQTSYRFYTGFGVSYTFGSIFNNVVNPRFPGF